MTLLSEQCPYCGQPITAQQLQAIRSRVRQEEERKFAALQQQRDRQHAAALQQLQQQHAEEQSRHQERLAQQRTEVTKVLEQKHANELQAQRLAFQKVADAEVLKVKEANARKHEALEKKVLDLERSLAQKSAHELGDGPERDLEQALREAFPEDLIQRVAKGENGADVIQQVMYQGDACGTIVYDSKNHKRWLTEFIVKQKSDMIRHGAIHGVIVSSAFPAGEAGFCIREGVIVVQPKAAVYVAGLLRDSLVQLYRKGLSAQERDSKMATLYDYLGGGEFSARMKEAEVLIGRLEAIDDDERVDHEKRWKSRFRALARMKAAFGDVERRIAEIMNTSGQDQGEPEDGEIDL